MLRAYAHIVSTIEIVLIFCIWVAMDTMPKNMIKLYGVNRGFIEIQCRHLGAISKKNQNNYDFLRVWFENMNEINLIIVGQM